MAFSAVTLLNSRASTARYCGVVLEHADVDGRAQVRALVGERRRRPGERDRRGRQRKGDSPAPAAGSLHLHDSSSRNFRTHFP